MVGELEKLYRKIKPDGNVLDVGCFGFVQVKFSHTLGLNSFKHYGVDYCDIKDEMPPNYTFRKADLNKEPLPFNDDMFDLVIASHIIEHLTNPVEFFGELARVCKPGG